jgi:23S rRNA (cytosine1962-C5)-methyltransferase
VTLRPAFLEEDMKKHQAAIVLDPDRASRLACGATRLPLSGGEARRDGDLAELRDPSGSLLGLAIVDGAQRVLRVWSRGPEPDPIEAIERAILSARRLREGLFGPFGREGETNAYRMLHGEGDGLGGLVVDAYAGFLVVQVLGEALLPRVGDVEAALEEHLEPRGIVRKLRRKSLEEDRGRLRDEVVRGQKPPEVLEVREAGVPFGVEILGGLHTGLFTDLREEHVRIRSLARGRRVLNTFAYTGAFSVAAALGGAEKVTSVDVVAKVLERARSNFLLAGLDPEEHHFARMEVLEFLRMAGRRGWRFDAIVLDPPTFATFKSGRWCSRTDYPRLLDLALSVLEPEGLLWMAANTEGFPAKSFEGMIAGTFEKSQRRARTLAVGGLPPDYPTPMDVPEARYLKVQVVQVS